MSKSNKRYYVKPVYGIWTVVRYTTLGFFISSHYDAVYGPYDTYEEAKDKADELNISSPPDKIIL